MRVYTQVWEQNQDALRERQNPLPLLIHYTELLLLLKLWEEAFQMAGVSGMAGFCLRAGKRPLFGRAPAPQPAHHSQGS